MRILCILALLWAAPAFAGTTISHPDKPVPWNTAIDHCWQFDEDYSDSCTGASPTVPLVATGAPEFSIFFPHTEGKGSIFFDKTESAGANTTTELATPAGDALTMWCHVKLTLTTSEPVGGGIMGKNANNSAGYFLQMGNLPGTAVKDLHGYEHSGAQNRGVIWDTWDVEPSPWTFVWWRARTASADGRCNLGRFTDTGAAETASCDLNVVTTDAAAEKFTIGRWPSVGQTSQGYYDNCGWDAANLDLLSLCRICSCGIRGEKCSCSGATYTSEGYNDLVCANCVLPPCNQAAPTTLTDAAPSWAAAIDHCWNFDRNTSDSCTGATAINLVPVGSPVNEATNVIQGTSIFFNGATPDGVQANNTTELAPPAGDTLTMWCWANVSTTASSQFMGKFLWDAGGSVIGPGYSLALGHKTGDGGIRDLLVWEGVTGTRARAYIGDIFTADPSGWNFVWWRAKVAAGDARCCGGRLLGASTIESATCDVALTATDANILFEIGRWSDPTVLQSSTGYYDECGWDANNLSDTSICRICSCGVNGVACVCNGTAYISEGRNNTHCGNCTLPACNLATPGTL